VFIGILCGANNFCIREQETNPLPGRWHTGYQETAAMRKTVSEKLYTVVEANLGW
jgi:hypothetical protein